MTRVSLLRKIPPRDTLMMLHVINMTGSDESQLSVSHKLLHAGFSPDTAEVGSPCFLFKVAAVANTTPSDVSTVCCLLTWQSAEVNSRPISCWKMWQAFCDSLCNDNIVTVLYKKSFRLVKASFDFYRTIETVSSKSEWRSKWRDYAIMCQQWKSQLFLIVTLLRRSHSHLRIRWQSRNISRKRDIFRKESQCLKNKVTVLRDPSRTKCCLLCLDKVDCMF